MKGEKKTELGKIKKDQSEFGNEAIAIVRSFLINEEGVLIGREERESEQRKGESLPEIIVNLPQIYGGEKVEGRTMRITLDFLKELKNEHLSSKVVEIYNQDLMVLTLEDSLKVLYNTSLEAKEMASALQIMLSSFKIEGKKPFEIDFRFGKPVIRF